MTRQDDRVIAEAVEEFSDRLPDDARQATEEEVQSTIEMVKACGDVYGVTPLQWIFHALQAMALATDCHSRFALAQKQDPHIVVVGLKLRTDCAPEVTGVKAYLEDEGEYK
ncbi:MAG: hypothetical protein OXG44_01305 [Gammaproteobacteria bacterium]|nr:hypothetical protein [Gammaproteobacteria bacterium]